MVYLPDVSAGKLEGCPIVALSVLFSPRECPLFNDITPGTLLSTEEIKYFEICIGDTFSGKVLVCALDFGPLGGIVDGIIGLLSAILSGLFSGDSTYFRVVI